MYLRNYWYVGAWSHELTTDAPFQRHLLGEPLVFYRTEDGEPAVLHDLCPHRFAPLSTGRVVGDAIECGYHGFTFNKTGACTVIPGMDKVPEKLCVRGYPAVEKWGWIFVWMGDPETADPATIPDFHYLDDPAWAGKGETMPVKANYTLLRDNLLDLTHAKFLHRTTLKTDAVTDFPVDAITSDKQINVRRRMVNIPQTSPLWTEVGGFTQPVTQWQNVEFTPAANIVIKMGVHSAENSTENKRIEFRILNALVPETENTTHYFWAIMRNFEINDDEMTEMTFTGNKSAFAEDQWIIEKQQAMMNALDNPTPIAVPHDKGVLRATQLVDRLIKQEQSAAE
ncbi:MAG: aromatic ring-hydroxylating dioxygenase subunit alpha [Proteobacteria bacterium]|nr:aromatic ring-hydroxylating dioxygenase subunit alpha [Pseudomonadota bacterium]